MLPANTWCYSSHAHPKCVAFGCLIVLVSSRSRLPKPVKRVNTKCHLSTEQVLSPRGRHHGASVFAGTAVGSAEVLQHVGSPRNFKKILPRPEVEIGKRRKYKKHKTRTTKKQKGCWVGATSLIFRHKAIPVDPRQATFGNPSPVFFFLQGWFPWLAMLRNYFFGGSSRTPKLVGVPFLQTAHGNGEK